MTSLNEDRDTIGSTAYFDCATSESSLAAGQLNEKARPGPVSAASLKLNASADNDAKAAIFPNASRLVGKRDEPPLSYKGAMQALPDDAAGVSSFGGTTAASAKATTGISLYPLDSPTMLTPPVPFNFVELEKEHSLKKEKVPRYRPADAPGAVAVRLDSPAMLAPPTPFDSTNFDFDKEDDLIKQKRNPRRAPRSEGEARFDDDDGGGGSSHGGAPPPANAADSVHVAEKPAVADVESAADVPRSSFDIVEDTPVFRSASMDDARVAPRETVIVPIAFPVEDDRSEKDIVVASSAEPVLAWWKQRPARLFFALVGVLLVSAFVALGISFSSNDPPVTQTFVAFTDVPSSSAAPSSSSIPSSSPTICAMKLVPRTEPIAMVVNDPYNPKVAVDGTGTDMVVVVQNRTTSSAYTIFYTLTEGTWNATHWFREDSHDGQYQVVFSNGTAIVGFPYEGDSGAVSVYERDGSGGWEKIEEPFVYGANAPTARFGHFLDLDGKLACVGDRTHFYLFRRDDGATERWVQFDRVDRGSAGYGTCSVAGDALAIQNYDAGLSASVLRIYRYDEGTGTMVPLQDPISLRDEGRVCMSRDRLVYTDISRGIFVHHREEEGQTFTLRKQFPKVLSSKGKLELGEHIFTVFTGRIARVIAEQDGDWVETLEFQHAYKDFRFSGQTLFATDETWVSVFDVEGCT